MNDQINNTVVKRERAFEWNRFWESDVLMPRSLKDGYYPTTQEWYEFFKENP